VDNIPSIFFSRNFFFIIAKDIRQLRLIWMLSQDIMGLLLAVTMKYTNYTVILMMPHVAPHFTIQVSTIITMSMGKHSDTDQLQSPDCILLWTVNMDLWSKSVD